MITYSCLSTKGQCPVYVHTVRLYVTSINIVYGFHLIHTLSVRNLINPSDSGYCILRYVSGIESCWEKGLFTVKSYEKDGYRSIISSSDKFSYNKTVVMKLREECLRLVCRVAQKYCSSRLTPKNSCASPQFEGDNCKCCSPTSFLPTNLTSINDEQEGGDSGDGDDGTCASRSYSDSESIFSGDTGSIYTPEDYGIELENSDTLYEDEIIMEHQDYDDSCQDSYSLSGQAHQNGHDGDRHDHRTSENGSVQGCDFESDDDVSVEECYSDYMSVPRAVNNRKTCQRDRDNEDVDNLICPGDVVEYRPNQPNSVIKKDSIVTIEHSKTSSYIVLKSGYILHPSNHTLRKVQMYCTQTKILIPNPLGRWVCASKCILQEGSILFDENNDDDSCDVDDSDNDHDGGEPM